MFEKASDFIISLYEQMPLFIQYLVIPLLFMLLLMKRHACICDWLLLTLSTGGIMGLLFYTSISEYTVGHYTMILLMILYLLSVLFSFFRIRRHVFFATKKAAGLLGSFSPPKNLEQYDIFDEILYSPCDGIVYYVQDGYEDMPPSSKKHFEDTGNGIVIQNGDIYVMMFHLKKDSILVKSWDEVKAGDPIGRIGNSGITRLPHLHIQASTGHWLYGESVPFTFDGKFPVKKMLFAR